MLFLKIWDFLLGYLVIRVEGLSLEKFINLCISRGIKLWGIRRIGYTSLTTKIRIKGFKALPPILRIIKCKVRIVHKKGFPFLINRFRHRKMLLVGLLIFLVLLYGLSSFIWSVEVEGSKNINTDLIYRLLKEKGVKTGVYKGMLNLWDIENEMLIEVPEISWISIEFKGTKAIVKAVERVNPPELIDKSIPCNIIASKDGIIDKLIIMEGEAAVGIGDTVTKGKLLVSGIIEHEDTRIVRYVHSRANVLARVWYEGRGWADFESVVKVRTGEKLSYKFLETRNWEIGAHNKEIPFEHYETEDRRELIPILGDLMGLTWLIRDYYELGINHDIDKADLAKELASKGAMTDVLKKIPKDANIIDKKFNYDIIKNEGCKALVYIEVLEDIAEQVELSIN
ncbi:MAG: sporulation protein YqfD [Clostridiales bacterium]|nr:sporulation protein YqfD [Clostridiales bacterium]